MSTYSSNLRIELITTGTQAGVWGNTTNTNLGTIVENSIAGYTTVSVLSANQAFTANNGSADEARMAMLRLTTTTTAAFAVYAPPVSKQYIIWNNSGYTATIYNSTVTGNTTAAGTGVAIADGDQIMVWSNGTNFYEVKAQNLTGTLAISKGGTGQVTANAAFNALAPSQASANGKYLKSDGTNTAWDQIDISTGDITGTLPVANGGTGVTTSTGSGNLVLSTSPTLTTPTLSSPTMTSPVLGTPASGNFSSGTFTWPTFNQNTSGTAAGLSTTLPVASGGTGQTTAALAGAALGAIGVGQTWQSVSRSAGVTYTNSTGRPIMVAISIADGGPNSGAYYFYVDGVALIAAGYDFGAAFSIIVPSGSTYSLALSNAGIGTWYELR